MQATQFGPRSLNEIAMKTSLTNAADTAAIEALLLVWDGEGNKSGILYD